MYKEFLNIFAEQSKNILGENLIGIYLHGSAAFGCFNAEKSDIDLILVVKNFVSKEQKRKFMDFVIEMNEKTTKKGIELSVVKKESCLNFVYPTPFELHFSNAHLNWYKENPEDYIEKMKGVDKDLAAHFTVINTCGIVLYGEETGKVFSSVPEKYYIDSIISDIDSAREDILKDPMYIILNLCRVLAYLEERKVLSKKEGAVWGLKMLPKKFASVVASALRCYESDEEMFADKNAEQFAKYMLNRIKNKTAGD